MSRVTGRFWIALLLCLNAVTLAWQWNAFARWGLGPDNAREPERMQQQIRPDAIRIETPAAAAERIAAEALPVADMESADPAKETPQDAVTGPALGTAKAATATSAAPTPTSPNASPNAPPSAASPASAFAVPAGRARVAPPETPVVGPRAPP